MNTYKIKRCIRKSGRKSRCMASLLAMVIFASVFLITGTEIFADNTVVTGTVSRGTNSSTLYLYNTSAGKYTIKINEDTNTSACKILTVGKTVTVSMYKGSDGNYYAASIASGTKAAPVSTTTSNKASITGTVTDATTESMLYLSTSGGTMQIKIDSTTDLSGCKMLVSGAQVTVTYARGSDAVNHALSVSSYNTASQNVTATKTGTGTNSASAVPANTVAVTGTPTSDSKEDVLYLKAKDGTYYIAIDSDTDTSGGVVFTTSNTLTAYIYRGSDAKMHAAKIIGTRSGNTTLNSGTANFEGTVENGSTEEILLLKTSGGTMKIKLDAGTVLSGTKGIVAGQKVTVNGSTGTDAYWHARTITATSTVRSSTSTTTTAPSGTTAVTGTPTNDSKNGELYLKTKDGTYYIIVDDGAAGSGFVFTESNTLTAYIYRGSDAKMHASKITGTRSSGGNVSSNTTSFTGTVAGNSTEEMLYLYTSGGTMSIKLDAGTTITNTKNLIKGQSITVNAAIGSDNYWHAVSIAGK